MKNDKIPRKIILKLALYLNISFIENQFKDIQYNSYFRKFLSKLVASKALIKSKV